MVMVETTLICLTPDLMELLDFQIQVLSSEVIVTLPNWLYLKIL